MKNLAACMVAAGCLLGGVSSFAATLEVGEGICSEPGQYDAAVACVNTVASGNTSSSDVVDIATNERVVFSYCFGPEGELPAGEGNVFGTDALFKNAQYVPTSKSPLVGAGVFADWMVDAKDLRGQPRVSPSGNVAIGCYQVNPTGLLLLVR